MNGDIADDVNKIREHEATERYLRAHKRPYTKEDGIYIVEVSIGSVSDET